MIDTPGLFDCVADDDDVELPPLQSTWLRVLSPEFSKPYYHDLRQFIAEERLSHQVFPLEQDVYNALLLTDYDQVRVLVVGQDPYHDDGQAHGLCFSVQPGIALPPSLKNIFVELKTDLGCRVPNNGCLIPWAKQGVLLLNTVLTVRAHQPASHQKRGWEPFTDAVIRAVNAKDEPVVFVLWGAHAQKKLGLIDASRHTVIASAHPSPLSASAGFFGSRPFSQINAALHKHGFPEIDWQLPDL